MVDEEKNNRLQQSVQSKGGLARAESLSKQERTDIARVAAHTRWASGDKKNLPKAINSGEFIIGDAIIPCAVLDDEAGVTRILTQQGFLTAIGRARAAKGGEGASVDGLPAFLRAKNLKPFITDELMAATVTPLVFITSSGAKAFGYKAELLPQVCKVYLDARDAKALTLQQAHVADCCDILVRALATIGIIAMIDEATGYQYDRDRQALEKLLQKYLSEELRRWVRTFPGSYFKEMCRLRGVQYRSDMKLPQYFGKLTNNVVYRRLAPCVLNELKKRNPKNDAGNRTCKHHQWLSEDLGHPKLLQHLGMVIGLMKISKDWGTFEKHLNTVAPVYPDYPTLFDKEDGE